MSRGLWGTRQGGRHERVEKASSHPGTMDLVDARNGFGRTLRAGGRHLIVNNGSPFAEGLVAAVLVGFTKLKQVPWLGWNGVDDTGVGLLDLWGD